MVSSNEAQAPASNVEVGAIHSPTVEKTGKVMDSEDGVDAELEQEANTNTNLEGKSSPSSLVKSIRQIQTQHRPNLTKFAPQRVNMEKGGKKGKGSRATVSQLRVEQGGWLHQEHVSR